MPLSEQEQRLLDEMERSLYHNDADFVATVGAARGRAQLPRDRARGAGRRRRHRCCSSLGVVLQQLIVGHRRLRRHVRGRARRRSAPPRAPIARARRGASAPHGRRRSRPAASWTRINDRWDRRQDDQRNEPSTSHHLHGSTCSSRPRFAAPGRACPAGRWPANRPVARVDRVLARSARPCSISLHPLHPRYFGGFTGDRTLHWRICARISLDWWCEVE